MRRRLEAPLAAGPGTTSSGASAPAFRGDPAQLTDRRFHLERQFGAHNYVSIRNEYFVTWLVSAPERSRATPSTCSVGDIGLGPRCCCVPKSDARARTIIRLIRMGQRRARLRPREM